MEEKNIFMNAEGAFQAIKDAVKYLGANGYVEGFMVLNATKKSGVAGMMQLVVGTKLDIAACLMMVATKSESVKDVIVEVGRIITERWEEYEAEMAEVCKLQEEEVDE